MNRNALLCALTIEAVVATLLICGAAAASGTADPEFSGMVWEKHGDWHLNGSSDSLRLGEALAPGGLITAGADGAQHSLIVLLPDGQRMLCECFEAKGCAQGFRVPAITPQPQLTAWNMFVAVRNVLLLRSASAETAFPVPAGRAAMASNFEMVAAVSAEGQISIAPALRVLPSGQYSLSVSRDLQPAADATKASVQSFDWSAGQTTAPVHVEGAGLYRIRVTDQAYVPRIEIEVLATSAASAPAEADGLKQARETILSWSHTHQNWPLHPFLRLYLESRLSSSSP